jgi:hypothetical protein
MWSYHPPAVPPRREGGGLEALRQDLDLLDRRLRAGIAEAVGRAVTGAVEGAVLSLLGGPPGPGPRQDRHLPGSYPREPPWGDPGDALAHDDAGGWPPAWDDPDDLPPVPAGREGPPDWLAALAAAANAAAWLARRPGLPPAAWAAAGLAGGLAALLAGRPRGLALGVAASALGSVALAALARSAAEALADREAA